jgi:hypothetical protein
MEWNSRFLVKAPTRQKGKPSHHRCHIDWALVAKMLPPFESSIDQIHREKRSKQQEYLAMMGKEIIPPIVNRFDLVGIGKSNAEIE